MPDEPERDFFAELKRRNVFRVAAMYAVVAWLLVQVADATFEVLGVPEAAHRILILVAAAGFPVAIALGWLFDWTSEGLVRTPDRGGDAVERPPRHRRIDFAISAFLVVALGMTLVAQRLTSDPVGSAEASSLVVLPFDDMSPGRDQEHFAHGMSEELLSALAALPHVRVIGRTSAEAVKREGLSIERIGETLDVGAVVEGSVRRAADRVRVTVQLLRVRDALSIWTDTYDEPMGDLFRLQGRIAADVAAALDLRLKAEAQPPPTNSLEAYDAYLTGRHLMGRQTVDSMAGAIERFEHATRADPDFALAWSGLSDALSLSWALGMARDPGVFYRSAEAAEKAVALRPDSAEAQTSLGRIQWMKREWRASEASLRKAIEINPGYAFAYQSLALVLVNLGEFEEGLAASHRSVDLEPLSPYMHVNLAGSYDATSNPEAALRAAQRASSLEPGNAFARFYAMGSLAYLGRGEEALAEVLALDLPEPIREALRAAFEAGGTDGIKRVMRDVAIADTGEPCGGLSGTFLNSMLGNVEAALPCLEAGARLPGMWANLYPAQNPAFDPLRDEPRFQQVLAEMRLAD